MSLDPDIHFDADLRGPAPVNEFGAALQNVLGEVEQHGVAVKPGSRFLQYLKAIGAVVADPLVDLNGADLAFFAEASNQAKQLVESRVIWDSVDPPLLVQKLSLIVDGQAMPDPRNTCDHARNTLAELTAVALCHHRGLDVTVTADEDACVSVPNSGLPPFAMECKRPTSMAKIERAIGDARAQISRRIAGENYRHGIIALCVDRLIDFPATQIEDFGEAAQERLTELAAGIERLAHRKRVYGAQVPVIGLFAAGAVRVPQRRSMHSFRAMCLTIADRHPVAEHLGVPPPGLKRGAERPTP